MSRTVLTLRDNVAAILSGIDLSSVADVTGAFERAARVFVQKAKIPETQQKQNTTLYSGVTDYTIDTDIFGTNIIDIKPQGISRQKSDFVFKKMQDDFDRIKEYNWSGTMATFDYQNGTPIIRIVSTLTQPKLTLDTMNDITGWTASGNASGLAEDQTFYYQNPASLRFNLASSGSQGILSKTISSVDLTDYSGVGVVFLALEMPDANHITSVALRLGSDNSNYYSVTNTESTLGAFVAGEFMLIPFDLSTATTTLSPDITAIDYAGIYINYDGTAQTNVRVGGLWISLPTPAQILYSTAGLFKVGDVVSNSITANTDEIILNDSAYTIYEYECALQILQQTGGTSTDAMTQRLDAILNGDSRQIGLYNAYRSENPSETLRSSGSYYDNE